MPPSQTRRALVPHHQEPPPFEDEDTALNPTETVSAPKTERTSGAAAFAPYQPDLHWSLTTSLPLTRC